MKEMEVIGVQQVLPSNTPVVVLREKDGERLLPIFIGMPEATAIGITLSDQDPPRPMTHDLFMSVISTFSVSVERVVITELRERTFYSEIYFRGPVGVESISARPSDAIALAVRAGADVFVEEDLLDEAGYISPPEEDESIADYEVEEFREFLDNVNPDDFAG